MKQELELDNLHAKSARSSFKSQKSAGLSQLRLR